MENFIVPLGSRNPIQTVSASQRWEGCAFLDTEGSCVLHCREWKMPFILWYGKSGNTGWKSSVKKKRRHNASSLKNVFWCERGKFAAQLWGTTSVQHFTPVLGWISMKYPGHISAQNYIFIKKPIFRTEKRFKDLALWHIITPATVYVVYVVCVVLKVTYNAKCNSYFVYCY